MSDVASALFICYTRGMDIRIATGLLSATLAFSATSFGDGSGGDDFRTGLSLETIDRFHQLYNKRDYQLIYAQYDASYTTETSPQRNAELYGRVREGFGRFMWANSVFSKSETRHGQRVFVVTEMAMFECGFVHEEFVFKNTNTVGRLLAYKYKLE
jgi:hypothetical protein